MIIKISRNEPNSVDDNMRSPGSTMTRTKTLTESALRQQEEDAKQRPPSVKKLKDICAPDKGKKLFGKLSSALTRSQSTAGGS